MTFQANRGLHHRAVLQARQDTSSSSTGRGAFSVMHAFTESFFILSMICCSGRPTPRTSTSSRSTTSSVRSTTTTTTQTRDSSRTVTSSTPVVVRPSSASYILFPRKYEALTAFPDTEGEHKHFAGQQRQPETH
jgi:hypothetical protein